MNTPAAGPLAPTPGTALDAHAGQPPRPRAEAAPHSREAFAAALRAHSARRHDDEPSASDASACAAASAAAACPPPALAHAATTPERDPVAVDAAPCGPRATIAASLAAHPGSIETPLPGGEPAARWQVCVRDPQGVSFQVHAERSVPAATQVAGADWSLAIAAPAPAMEALARHVPQLRERLRRHGAVHAHVRIEGDDEEAP